MVATYYVETRNIDCYELKYNDEPNYHILMELFIQTPKKAMYIAV